MQFRLLLETRRIHPVAVLLNARFRCPFQMPVSIALPQPAIVLRIVRESTQIRTPEIRAAMPDRDCASNPTRHRLFRMLVDLQPL